MVQFLKGKGRLIIRTENKDSEKAVSSVSNIQVTSVRERRELITADPTNIKA